MSRKHLIGLGLFAVLALVISGVFASQEIKSASASPLDITVNGQGTGTVTVNNGDTITIKATFNQPFSNFIIAGSGTATTTPSFTGQAYDYTNTNALGCKDLTSSSTPADSASAQAVRAAITNMLLVSATEDTLASNPTSVTASMGADTDGSGTNGCARFTGPSVVIAGTNLNMTLTAKVNCPTANIAGLHIDADQNINGRLQSLVVVNCNVTGANGPSNTISIKKIDQLGVIRGASFAVQQEVPTASGNWVNVATMVTSSTVASQNPCVSNTNCTTNPGLQTAGALPPTVTGGATLPTGVALRVVEIAQPASCTLVQITDGDGDLVVQPVTLTFPARVNDATLTFINSCQTPLAPLNATSAIAVVIGGATQGLSNSTHIEIIPAPGSDDDARIDVRVRDANSTNVTGAHVTVSIDKGALAMRTDTTGPGANCTTNTTGVIIGFDASGNPIYGAGTNPAGTILPGTCYAGSGYEVIEPAPGSVYFGSNYAGDTCDQGLQQPGVNGNFTYNPATNTYTPISQYSGSTTAPFLSITGTGQLRQIQDGFTNVDGIISSCVYVNPNLAPGVTPGKINVTVIIESPQPAYYTYGAGNIILTATITVVGPPASIKVAASPTSVQCGEKSTITATVTDSVGQNVSDHTRVELVSNAGATIGGTGSTLGFPGVGAINPASSSVAETFSGVATAFLLTSTEHVGPYEVVVASGGSVGGVVTTGQPGVDFTTGNFSTAPVSAQVTVTCALPVTAAAPAPAAAAPIAAPRTGEGIRPPNTGDAGLADSNSSSALFIVGGLVFALAGVATLKFARR